MEVAVVEAVVVVEAVEVAAELHLGLEQLKNYCLEVAVAVEAVEVAEEHHLETLRLVVEALSLCS